MGKLQKNESGFSAVELLLVILILVVIGAVGYMVYHNDHKTTPAPVATTSATKPTTPIKSSTTTTPSDSTLVLQRQQYIDKYITANTTDNWEASYYTSIYQSGYLSTKNYDAVQSQSSNYNDQTNSSANPAYDELICINELPSSYTYGTVTVSGTTATLPVNVYVSGSSTPTAFTANWVKTNGVWQLDSTACSQE